MGSNPFEFYHSPDQSDHINLNINSTNDNVYLKQQFLPSIIPHTRETSSCADSSTKCSDDSTNTKKCDGIFFAMVVFIVLVIIISIWPSLFPREKSNYLDIPPRGDGTAKRLTVQLIDSNSHGTSETMFLKK